MVQGDRLRRDLAVANGRERKDRCDLGSQLRLVLFDDHDIIPALVDHDLRDVALGQERVHRDNTPLRTTQDRTARQREESG
jgi:hypothetical protein